MPPPSRGCATAFASSMRHGGTRPGKVAGAALDVCETEPYSGPLLELEEVLSTPHLAGSTTEAQDRAGVMIAEQVVAALDGRIVQTAVNIPALEPGDPLDPAHF